MAEDCTTDEYEAALASERKDRAEAMLGLPELIAGIQVEPLTPRRLEWLRAMNNPFICGGSIIPASYVQFLWTVSKAFKLSPTDEERQSFAAPIITQAESDLREGIELYIDRAFLDAPQGKEGIAFYSPSAGIYHSLNVSFPGAGWHLERVMDTPMRIAYQLIKAADRERGCALINRRSFAIQGKMLDEVANFQVETEAEVVPFIDFKRTEGWLLFSQPMELASGNWLIVMRKVGSNG